MRNRLAEFLILLALDREKRREFLEDPDRSMSASDLNDSEKEVLRTRNSHLIRTAAFQKEKGSLTVVGAGISLVSHLTWEARMCIEGADRVLHGMADPVTGYWIEMLNPRSESLNLLYQPGRPRMATYEATVERILAYVRAGYRVCVVFYGHPGVFVHASHESIRRARKEGYSAVMLPGISAEDCLFSDLGVDPGEHGYQCFEATNFLTHPRTIDTRNSLVLWQIGAIGVLGYENCPNWTGLKVLVDFLQEYYPQDHQTVVYEAAQFPITKPVIQKISLIGLLDATITAFSTLYIPPVLERPVSP